ncbi:preprotein translocase subunit YajC [Corynebacterium terpenotabidum]|uniref:Protein-export membrane protein n=1 Tax=Corynebacterium terpenotabidum Y-11 TaxID=1200352 RepID=S4XE89_9CORY|nr:preprotein translocase subunit YajC [Corynebacterium terpenotabidum]AGP30871.1 protein-export membrane protein [Corynebacterium terpenotabidum Y-11]
MDILLLALLVVVFLGLPVLQMRKQSKQIGEIRNFQSQLTPGMIVQLTSGLHGRIADVGETTVDVEIAPGIITTWERAAVLKLVDSVAAGSAEADHLTGSAADQVPDDLSSLDAAAERGEDIAEQSEDLPDDADRRDEGESGRP